MAFYLNRLCETNQTLLGPASDGAPDAAESLQERCASDARDAEAADFYELVLRDNAGLDRFIVEPELQESGVRQLLGVSVAGTLLYGAMVGLVAQLSGEIGWLGRWPVLTLPLALTGAFLGALAICLPSFYFYTQLSGVDASLRIVTGQALRAQARTSVLLLGVLPIYVALALASVVGLIEGGSALVSWGLALPFLVGLWGLRSLWSSFRRLSTTLPVAHVRRPCFLPRMVLAWGLVYSVVAPVALSRLIEALAIAL
jgi:hypothetical protein